MTYTQAIEYLYAHAPMFQKIGSKAYKSGLENTYTLDIHFDHPHMQYKTIHVAGTNGKGSTCHLLASTLQCAGYKVGLYTSPHLKDFRERIRVNGEMISKMEVINFIKQNQNLIELIQPSFFEITTAMAFHYFAKKKVDIAVIEVGLGGRLDCTNIITPLVSVITNISYDHMNLLGNTLEEIATQKAGIIKRGIPVVIGEYQNSSIKNIFAETAAKIGAPITFAQENHINVPECELKGIYQEKNKQTVAHVIAKLQKQGIKINRKNIADGFAQVIERTGLQGRWQTIGCCPTIVCDTGHNEGGYRYLSKQLQQQKCKSMRIVFGMVSDKDISAVLEQLPKNATYYFTNANIPRALNAEKLKELASKYNLQGKSYKSVKEALKQAKKEADKDDFIFVGGSNFVIAEIL